MLGRKRRDDAVTKTVFLPHPNRLVLHDRRFPDRNLAEIRPDRPVEYMVLQYLQGRRGGIDRYRRMPHVGHRIDHQGQGGNMIEVRMGDENVVDHCQLGQGKVSGTSACIDQYILIDKHRRSAQMAPADSPAAAQNPDFHCHPTDLCAAGEDTGQTTPTHLVIAFKRHQLLRKNSILIPASSITS